MSLDALKWAWTQSLAPAPKLVLLALADHYNDDTARCTPSLTRLSSFTGMHRRTVQRNLETLEFAGLIERIVSRGGSGPNASSRYVLRLDRDGALSSLFERRGGDTPTPPKPRGGTVSNGGGNPYTQGWQSATRTNKNHLEPSADPPAEKRSADDAMDIREAFKKFLPQYSRPAAVVPLHKEGAA